jgi:hypothetical protein
MLDVRILIAIVVVLVVAVAVYAYRKSRAAPPPSDAKYASGAPASCATDADCGPGTCVDGKCADSALGALTAAAAASAAALAAGVATVSTEIDKIIAVQNVFSDTTLQLGRKDYEEWNPTWVTAINAATPALAPATAAAKAAAAGYLTTHAKFFATAHDSVNYTYMTLADASAYNTLASAALTGARVLAAAVAAASKAAMAVLLALPSGHLTKGGEPWAPKTSPAAQATVASVRLITPPSGDVVADPVTSASSWSPANVAKGSGLDIALLATAAAADAEALYQHFK